MLVVIDRLPITEAVKRYPRATLARKLGISKQRVGQMITRGDNAFVEFDGEECVRYYVAREVKK